MIRRLALPLVAAMSLAGPALRAEMTPGEITALMERAADWQLANPAKWSPVGWHNAAFYSGVVALAKVSTSPRFVDQLRQIGERNNWQLGPRPYHADDHAVGQTYVNLYQLTPDPRMLAPMRAALDLIIAQPKDNLLEFDKTSNPDHLDRWSWCDALFMAPPALAKLSQVTGDPRYLDFALRQWWVTSDYLYDPVERLYLRDSRYFTLREKNGTKVFWARGNGWVLAGLVKILQLLPADHLARPRFEKQFREMAASVLACQQTDGLWRASLLDPSSYPMKESSGSSFFCYAISWGVNDGLLPRDPYAAAALKAWTALTGFVQPDGKFTHVQPVGFTPVVFDENHTEPYGVGAFLLAGSEVIRLVRPPARTL